MRKETRLMIQPRLLFLLTLSAFLFCAAPPPAIEDCGDGDVEIGEECDDGDTESGDGCDDECEEQDGFECTGEPSVCVVDDCGNGEVDAGEQCDGGPCCDDDCNFEPSVQMCRDASGGCDAVEMCTGSSAQCPSDSLAPSTVVCRPAVNTDCDVEEVCDGLSAECADDVLVGCPDVDGIDCVHPACDVSGECTTTDECVEICKGPNFWANRGLRTGGNGNGNGNNGGQTEPLIDIVLGEVGTIEVCGEVIDNTTDLGDLDSALEALCVQTRGVEERRLYRALVTTQLNCLVSEGGDCDDILSRLTEVSFTECNSICQDIPVPDGPTIDECIEQLECFNEGGRVIDGECAAGTCEDDPEEFCGDDFEPCEDLDGDEALEEDDEEVGDDCIPFDDSCAGEKLCTDDLEAELQICPRKLRPVSQKICRDARRNDCTIDSCD
jgi:cysteine-rich repeat protein